MSRRLQPRANVLDAGAGAWRGAVLVGVLGVVMLFVGLNGSQYQGKLSKVEKNDNTAFLPASSESTKVDKEAQRYQSVQAIPGFVVYQRTGGLTQADRNAINAEAQVLSRSTRRGLGPGRLAPIRC